jgi:hypothetical protein
VKLVVAGYNICTTSFPPEENIILQQQTSSLKSLLVMIYLSSLTVFEARQTLKTAAKRKKNA